MTEYLLCVSLVYIPIACWIAYLLHRDGFNIKTIILVLALSYLMITAFPQYTTLRSGCYHNGIRYNAGNPDYSNV